MTLKELVGVIDAPYLLKCSVSTLDDYDDEHEPLDFNGYVTDLPKGFLELDGKFHNQAGMLSHAADMENTELANFYTYKMQESCISCHSTYAQSKFPLFSKTLAEDVHSH